MSDEPVKVPFPVLERSTMSRKRFVSSSVLALLFLVTPLIRAAEKPEAAGSLPPGWFRSLDWRPIGPAHMSGRIVRFAVSSKDPSIWWVASASGGLLKTTNNGVTFEHQFDHEATVSIGDVCVAPSNPDIVWVGTGEHNPRNSVSYGDGVYKSTDGGKTWKNMGLNKTFQIGRIAIHPTNPDIVYVGALGRLYGPNPERGLFKTSDGGQTWEKVLFLDDRTGIIDMQMQPTDPDTLLVAAWERLRDGYDGGDPSIKWSERSGLYKTSDAGKTWKKLTQGLPTCKMGRIGLDYYRKDPNIVFALIDTEKIGTGPDRVAGNAYMGIQGENADKGARLTRIIPQGPSDKAGLAAGDVVVAVDDKAVNSYQDLIAAIRAHQAKDKVKVKVVRGKENKVIDLTFGSRRASGRPGRPFMTRLGGQRANAKQQGKEAFQYGGLYKSVDGGESWERINSINPRPMYFSQVRVDPSDANLVYVLGLSLQGSRDGGKTFRTATRGVHADQHALWIDPGDGRHMIVGTDGGFYVTYDRMAHWEHYNNFDLGQFYHVALDPRRNYRVFGGLQDNGSWGGPSRTVGRPGPINEDWFRVGGGDGFTCQVDPSDPDIVYSTMQYGGMRRVNLRTGESVSLRPRSRYRFNWKTPFILSHKDPKIFYCAANFVFRSENRGEDLKVISPEITTTPQGTGTAVAESPRNPDVLWAGTDDGTIWVTQDGGENWANVARNVGLPGPRWVATIEPSRFVEGRAYVCFDGHRCNDDDPHLYVTEDFGKTWRSLRGNLPWGSSRCLREDLVNPDLLYCGTEFAVFASLDRGQSWMSINNNLPTVAVHELAQHPSTGELVAATHGRSLWILDVTALRQFDRDSLKKPRFYKPAPAQHLPPVLSHGRAGRQFRGTNPPTGAQLYYSLPEKAERVNLRIVDKDNHTVQTLRGLANPGLQRVSWNLRRGGRRFSRQTVPAGQYTVVLQVNGSDVQEQPLLVEGPAAAVPIAEERDGAEEDVEDY
jgi:photosystem II stability/assembly factor-like uncharacterized protein